MDSRQTRHRGVARALHRLRLMSPWSSHREAGRRARGGELAMVYAAGVFAVGMVIYLIVFLVGGR